MDTMETPLRLAGVIRESIVDGPGWRFVVLHRAAHTTALVAKTRKRTISWGDMTARWAT